MAWHKRKVKEFDFFILYIPTIDNPANRIVVLVNSAGLKKTPAITRNTNARNTIVTTLFSFIDDINRK